jgi:glycosyltransferase involved in cell wall biosynthesis
MFIAASADRYGADAVLHAVAGHMRSDGASCTIVFPAEGPGADLARAAGLRTIVAPVPVIRRAELNPRGLAKFASLTVRGSVALRRIIRAEAPDLVWVNTVTIPAWILGSRLFATHVICHSHEVVGHGSVTRRVLYGPLAATHRTLAVSGACRDDIAAVYPRLAPKVAVALNPSFAISGPVQVQAGREADVAIIGRVSARKGHEVLFDALEDPALAALRPTVHVCGEAYDSAPARRFAAALEERARALPGQVRFHGYIAAASAYAQAGIVCVPSIEPEACPLVIAEAMAAGRAVVASDIGGIRELLGGAGVLVPPGRADLLANALATVAGDADRRRDLEHASVERARELTPERYFARVDSIVRDVLGSSTLA